MNSDFAAALDWLGQYLGVASQTASSHSYSIASPISRRSDVRAAKQPAPAALVHKMTSLARDAMMQISASHFDQLKDELRIPVPCMRSLCVGYSADHRATTWPMRDGEGRITGIRLRSIDTSTKWSIAGSVAGLFLSRDHKPAGDRLLIVEGASDMAAAIDLDLVAIGRPSCHGSVPIVVNYLRRHRFQSAVVLADNDSAGLGGATALANDLARSGIDARVITPPAEFDDLRSWHQVGIIRQHVLTRPSSTEHPRRNIATQLAFNFNTGAENVQSV